MPDLDNMLECIPLIDIAVPLLRRGNDMFMVGPPPERARHPWYHVEKMRSLSLLIIFESLMIL